MINIKNYTPYLACIYISTEPHNYSQTRRRVKRINSNKNIGYRHYILDNNHPEIFLKALSLRDASSMTYIGDSRRSISLGDHYSSFYYTIFLRRGGIWQPYIQNQYFQWGWERGINIVGRY